MSLPDTWSETTLGECQGKASTIDPRSFPAEVFDLYSVPSHANYAPEQVSGSDIGSTKLEVAEHDVLLCKIVPHIRRGWAIPAAAGRRQIASSEWIVLREHGIEPEFLRRFVLSDGFHDQFMLTVSGVGGSLMRARPADAGTIAVPLPPSAEQRRIVAKLDALTARITRARAELDRVEVLAENLRSRILGNLFDLSRAMIDGTPVAVIEDVASISSGFGFPKHLQGKTDGKYPFAKVSDISRAVAESRGELSHSANYVDDDDLKLLRAKPVPAGSIVFAKIGEALRLNRRAVTSSEVVLDNNCMALSPSSKVEPHYLFFFMKTVDLSPFAVATTVPSVRRADVADLRLPLPDRPRQQLLIDKCRSAFARADRLEAEAARVRKLLYRLESAILSKAFRGELVPQDPNDEPASVLLERIRANRAAAPKTKRGKRAAGR